MRLDGYANFYILEILSIGIFFSSLCCNCADPRGRQIYAKLKDVIEENKELEKMVSAGRIEQLRIEIAMLKRENELGKDRIEGFETLPPEFY
jgi:hypothetical protein